jgi:hypothetical protein
MCAVQWEVYGKTEPTSSVLHLSSEDGGKGKIWNGGENYQHCVKIVGTLHVHFSFII